MKKEIEKKCANCSTLNIIYEVDTLLINESTNEHWNYYMYYNFLFSIHYLNLKKQFEIMDKNVQQNYSLHITVSFFKSFKLGFFAVEE